MSSAIFLFTGITYLTYKNIYQFSFFIFQFQSVEKFTWHSSEREKLGNGKEWQEKAAPGRTDMFNNSHFAISIVRWCIDWSPAITDNCATFDVNWYLSFNDINRMPNEGGITYLSWEPLRNIIRFPFTSTKAHPWLRLNLLNTTCGSFPTAALQAFFFWGEACALCTVSFHCIIQKLLRSVLGWVSRGVKYF